MCEFAGWVEKGDKVYYLTYDLIHNTPRGDMIQKKFPGEGELIGHAAIRAYFNIRGGDDKECTDFSTPDNFPEVIVKAIKNGEMRDFGYPVGLLKPESLTPETVKAYAAREKANATWHKADATWHKADAAWEKADAAWRKAYAGWEKAYAAREKAYTARVKANAARHKATADWEKANADWEKVNRCNFWDLFENPDNRTEAWRYGTGYKIFSLSIIYSN